MFLESLIILIFNVLFVRVISQTLWGVIYKRAKSNLDNIHSKRLLAFLISLIFASIEIQAFIQFQIPNYYQLYNLNRNFTPSQLRNSHKKLILLNHPDKNPNVDITQYYLLKQINDVFQSQQMKQIYDIFGEVPEQQKQSEFDNSVARLQNQYIISFILFYLICILMVLIQTYHRDLRAARTKIIGLILIFAYNEWQQMNDKDYPIILAYFTPQLTINQIIQIQRILITTFIVGMIFYQRCLTRGMEWTLNSLEFCSLEINKNNQQIIIGVLQDISNNLETIRRNGLLQAEQANSKQQKIINAIVMVLMVLFVSSALLQQYLVSSDKL